MFTCLFVWYKLAQSPNLHVQMEIESVSSEHSAGSPSGEKMDTVADEKPMEVEREMDQQPLKSRLAHDLEQKHHNLRLESVLEMDLPGPKAMLTQDGYAVTQGSFAG